MTIESNTLITMEKKYTPGPWGLRYTDKDELEIGMAGTNRVTGVKSDAGFGDVALVIHRQTNILGDSRTLMFQTFEANAKLIAAAPELLEALIDAYLSMYQGNCKTLEECMNRGEQYMDEFEKKLVRAIKKATEY